MHDAVGIRQLARDAVVTSDHVRLACQVAGEQQAGTNLVLIEERQQVDPVHIGFRAQRDREAEPRWVRVWRRFRQDQELRTALQAVFHVAEIVLARLHKTGRAVHLRQAASGLHVGDFQVVAQVAVGVLVIVAFWQRAQLAAETLTASIVLARCAVAVAAPVAE